MKKRKILLYLITLALIVGFILTFNIDLDTFSTIQNYYFVAIAFITYLFSILIIALRTRYFLHSVNEKDSGIIALIKTELINKFAYYTIPGRFNIPIKAIALHKFFNINKTKSLSITSFEFIFDISITLFIASIGLFFFAQGLPYFDLNKFILFAGFIIGLILIFFKFPKKWINSLINYSEKIKNKLISKIFTSLFKLYLEARKTWKTIIFNKKIYSIIFFTAIYWLLSALTFVFLFQSAGISASIGYVFVITGIGIFIAGISQVPGGLGVRDGAMVFLFSLIGYPEAISTMVVITTRLFSIVPTIIGYFISTKLNNEKDSIKSNNKTI